MKTISRYFSFICLLFVLVSCEKNITPNPYQRVDMYKVKFGSIVNECQVAQSKIGLFFAVFYQKKEITIERYDTLCGTPDYDVRIGKIGDAAVIVVISKPLYCAKLFICHNDSMEVKPIEIKRYSEFATQVIITPDGSITTVGTWFYFGPAIFYAPGEIRVAETNNPNDTPVFVFPVDF